MTRPCCIKQCEGECKTPKHLRGYSVPYISFAQWLIVTWAMEQIESLRDGALRNGERLYCEDKYRAEAHRIPRVYE